MEKENWTAPHNIRYSARREHFAPPLFFVYVARSAAGAFPDADICGARDHIQGYLLHIVFVNIGQHCFKPFRFGSISCGSRKLQIFCFFKKQTPQAAQFRAYLKFKAKWFFTAQLYDFQEFFGNPDPYV